MKFTIVEDFVCIKCYCKLSAILGTLPSLFMLIFTLCLGTSPVDT